MIEQVESLLKTLIGLDLASIGRGSVERALRQRLAASGESESGFLALLRQSPAERQALVDAVVVPETWFFRYPESFVLLERLARARPQALAGARPLRILSLPCSTGEEPYSIAMCLLNAGFTRADFVIDAQDVSATALDAARQGRYGANAFRGGDLGFRERYFQPEAGFYRLGESVRGLVNFRLGTVLEAGAATPYDVVFCRNLLIYFDRPTQVTVVSHLGRLLGGDGVLFAGPAEAGVLIQQGMEPLNHAQSFAFRRRPVPAKVAPAAPTPSRPAPPSYQTMAGRISVPPHKPSVAPRPDTGDTAEGSLAQIARLADSGRHAEAEAACTRHLDRHGPSAGLFCWWGLLCDGTGQPREAETYYRKALYLEPWHAETVAHLAALLRLRGDLAGAARLKQRLQPAAGAGHER